MANKVDVRACTLYSYGPVSTIQFLSNTGIIRSKPGHRINLKIKHHNLYRFSSYSTLDCFNFGGLSSV